MPDVGPSLLFSPFRWLMAWQILHWLGITKIDRMLSMSKYVKNILLYMKIRFFSERFQFLEKGLMRVK